MLEELAEVYSKYNITDFTNFRRYSDTDTGFTRCQIDGRQFRIVEYAPNDWLVEFDLEEGDIHYDEEDEELNLKAFRVRDSFEAVIKRVIKRSKAEF